MKALQALPLSLLWFAFAAGSEGQMIVDQQQTMGTTLVSYLGTAGQAQSFRPTRDHIAGASILLWAGAGNPSVVRIALWDDLPTSGGTQLTVGHTATAVPGQWADVFWEPYPVNPGQTYYLTLSGSDRDNAVAGDVNDPYPDGQAYTNGYLGFPQFDFAFKTWFDSDAVEATETVRLGTIPNPDALRPGWSHKPIVGETWNPWVDHSAFMPNAIVDSLFIAEGSADDFMSWGSLLVDPRSWWIVYNAVNPGTAFQVPIPNDLSLAGATYATQCASYDGTMIRLTNAIDIVVGTF